MFRILIVEDDFIIAYDLMHVLLNEKYEVDVANTYQDAIKSTKQNSYDLIICDINLGKGPNGVDFIENLQKKNSNFSFVYLTAYSDNEILERASKTNPLNYLIKPWTKAQITIAVKIALQQNLIKNGLLNKFDEVINLNNILENKYLTNSKLTSIALHDIRSPISFFNNYIRHLINNISNVDIIENLKKLEDASIKVSSLNEEIFTWIKYSNDNIKPKIVEINISELLNNLIKDYIPLINIHNNIIESELLEGVIINSDLDLLKIMIRNILDNACKYTKNGKIITKLLYNENRLCLCITNSLVETNMNDSSSFNVIHSTGLGLKLIEDFSKLLNIEYNQITNKENEYQFTLFF